MDWAMETAEMIAAQQPLGGAGGQAPGQRHDCRSRADAARRWSSSWAMRYAPARISPRASPRSARSASRAMSEGTTTPSRPAAAPSAIWSTRWRRPRRRRRPWSARPSASIIAGAEGAGRRLRPRAARCRHRPRRPGRRCCVTNRTRMDRRRLRRRQDRRAVAAISTFRRRASSPGRWSIPAPWRWSAEPVPRPALPRGAAPSLCPELDGAARPAPCKSARAAGLAHRRRFGWAMHPPRHFSLPEFLARGAASMRAALAAARRPRSRRTTSATSSTPRDPPPRPRA